MIPPEQALSLREQALETIRLAITTGEMDENKIYSAAALAKQLGVSLSPVREAMMALVSEGTVEAIPNRGFHLVPITEDELEEIIRIRVILSRPAVATLCSRVTAEQGNTRKIENTKTHIATLANLAQEAHAATLRGDSSAFTRIDREFHRSLLEFGLGRRAADISLRLRDQSRRSFEKFDVHSRDALGAQDLLDLVQLIKEGDSAAAQTLVEANLFFHKRLVEAQDHP